MTREEKLKLFQEGRKRLEEENKKKENQKNFKKEYDPLNYLSLKDNQYFLVRMIGVELPPNDPKRGPTL